MMGNKGIRMVNGITAAGLLLVLWSVPVLAAEVHHFANGITATIHSPAEISAHLITSDKTGIYLTHPAAGSVALADNASDMHPFDGGEVAAALEAMQGFTTTVEVDVFILPATPTKTGSSFARRGAIYLAPGTGPVDPTTLAYITTHEMGHVLTWAYLDGYDARWNAYLDLRNLDAAALDPAARHADRAREILAEDIRALFGGTLATVTGSIENHELVMPQQVRGLRELLAGFFLKTPDLQLQLVSRAFPNPCNPRTSIEMALPAGSADESGDAILRLFDIRGALVKTVRGGQIANSRLVIQWDGTDGRGGVVSSGRYLYVLEMGQIVSKGAVTLVR
jgi:hypothetical protein